MSIEPFYIVLVNLAILAVVVSIPEELPKEGECGILNTDYYYNKKTVTEIDEFPWIGRVLYENTTANTFRFQCFTALISQRFVLLKAACFDYEEEPYKVYMGDWNTENDKEKSDCDTMGRCAPVPHAYDIDEIILHNHYNSKFKYNDIALIKLGERVVYSDFIRPICLPKRDVVQKNFINQHLEVVGWYTDRNVSEILSKTFVRVVNLKSCEAVMQHFTIYRKSNICAHTCSGKNVFSIGSLLMDVTMVDGDPGYYYLLGMNIHGLKVCSLLYPDVYIRVDRYLDWIYANIV